MLPIDNPVLTQIKPQVVYQNDIVRIELDTDAKYIFLKWLQHPSSPDFRESFMKAVDIAIDNGCKYWLSDARAVHYIELADQNWILKQIAPLTPKAALTKFARLSTLESLSLMDVPRVYNELEQLPSFSIKIELGVFTTVEEALEWMFNS